MGFEFFGGRRLLFAGSRLGWFWALALAAAVVLLVVLYREERRLVTRHQRAVSSGPAAGGGGGPGAGTLRADLGLDPVRERAQAARLLPSTYPKAWQPSI